MSTTVNREAYTVLIEEDVARLREEMVPSLERDHIELVLRESVDFCYPLTSKNRKRDAKD